MTKNSFCLSINSTILNTSLSRLVNPNNYIRLHVYVRAPVSMGAVGAFAPTVFEILGASTPGF